MKWCEIGLVVTLLFGTAESLCALNADTPILQYGHKAWRVDELVLRDAAAGITQILDGIISLGSSEIQASNNDGVSSHSTHLLDFRVLPTSHQTLWFLALCAVIAVLLGWLTYLIRVRQMQERASVTAEAIARERERIAQELHDTLLQGLQGLVYKIGAVAERLPNAAERSDLESALDRAEEMISEARVACPLIIPSDHLLLPASEPTDS